MLLLENEEAQSWLEKLKSRLWSSAGATQPLKMRLR